MDDFWADHRRFSPSPRAVDATPALPPRFREPPDFTWGVFATPEGSKLRWGHLAASTPRAYCVLVGGFTEFVEKYFETIGDLVARGLSVWCLDWHGQGGSQRPVVLPNRPRARLFDRDASDLAAFASSVLPRDGKRVLIAHSMGGAIALLCLHAHRGLFDAAVLSAPMLGLATGGIPAATARLIASTATLSGFGSLFIPGARQWRSAARHTPALSRTSSDPERCRVHRAWFEARPELTVEGPTYGWLDAAFRVTERIQRADFLSRIPTPTLIGSAGLEAFVDRRVHRHAAICMPDCTLVELPHSKHEPFLETDAVRDHWLAAIDQFLAPRLGS
ncbi:MAG TPA: alpha/beta hydrolase [Stellaceae bacterium]|nr:alpha/beta hydrolase [Stellaceae bacterium]